MHCALDKSELLRLTRDLEEPLPVAHRNRLVGGAVDDEQWRIDRIDVVTRSVLVAHEEPDRRPWILRRRDIDRRGEWRLQHQRSGRPLRRRVGGDAGAERLAVYDDVGCPLRQPVEDLQRV